MTIWRHKFTIQQIDEACRGTMVEHCGIEFLEAGNDYLTARMPVDHRTIQPFGVLHGGASTVLAETLGSIASNYCVDHNKFFCVGLDINSSHIRMAKEGFVKAVAHPVNLGSTIHVWQIKIYDERDRLISLHRLTTTVLKRKNGQEPVLLQR